tara:strand:+ start:952 stop:1188 length:237 start_codon:yes stop_codon:yes gene_type:complete
MMMMDIVQFTVPRDITEGRVLKKEMSQCEDEMSQWKIWAKWYNKKYKESQKNVRKLLKIVDSTDFILPKYRPFLASLR